MDEGYTAKWYQEALVDDSVVISSRVRFARNFKDYLFPIKINDGAARRMTDETAETVLNCTPHTHGGFKFYDASNSSQEELLHFMERHAISSHMVTKPGVKGLIINSSENVSIMLNEEDHVRIQSIFPGDNIDSAYDAADAMDTLIEGKGVNDYAYDQEYGYLTACPTNVGTGMRASFMLHLPALEASNIISKLVPALGKFGMTVRGIHGEGSESLGSIYQLSNQITLGKPESEILLAIKTAAMQVIYHENTSREKAFSVRRVLVEDRLYRSYGILKTCRTLNLNEGISLLSDVRLGFLSGVYTMERPKKTIYNLMMDIQPGNLARMRSEAADRRDLDIFRAEYVRNNL